MNEWINEWMNDWSWSLGSDEVGVGSDKLKYYRSK